MAICFCFAFMAFRSFPTWVGKNSGCDIVALHGEVSMYIRFAITCVYLLCCIDFVLLELGLAKYCH